MVMKTVMGSNGDCSRMLFGSFQVAPRNWLPIALGCHQNLDGSTYVESRLKCTKSRLGLCYNDLEMLGSVIDFTSALLLGRLDLFRCDPEVLVHGMEKKDKACLETEKQCVGYVEWRLKRVGYSAGWIQIYCLWESV